MCDVFVQVQYKQIDVETSKLVSVSSSHVEAEIAVTNPLRPIQKVVEEKREETEPVLALLPVPEPPEITKQTSSQVSTIKNILVSHFPLNSPTRVILI